MSWFSVRCVFHWDTVGSYEERITLWEADDAESAIAKAEVEAKEYEADSRSPDSEYSLTYVGLAQSYEMIGEPRDGVEAFSLLRDSYLSPTEYLDRFFNSGGERQQLT